MKDNTITKHPGMKRAYYKVLASFKTYLENADIASSFLTLLAHRQSIAARESNEEQAHYLDELHRDLYKHWENQRILALSCANKIVDYLSETGRLDYMKPADIELVLNIKRQWEAPIYDGLEEEKH